MTIDTEKSHHYQKPKPRYRYNWEHKVWIPVNDAAYIASSIR